MLDFLVICVSIAFEVVYSKQPEGWSLVVARLWRFARIAHGPSRSCNMAHARQHASCHLAHATQHDTWRTPRNMQPGTWWIGLTGRAGFVEVDKGGPETPSQKLGDAVAQSAHAYCHA